LAKNQIKLVPTNTAGSWFQCVRWEIGSNKYSGGKTTMRNWFQPIRRKINFNQYSGKYFVGNSSNQKGGTFVPINTAVKLVPTNTAGKQNNRELVPTNMAGKFA